MRELLTGGAPEPRDAARARSGATPTPRPWPVAAVARVLEQHYGVTIRDAQPLGGEVDQNLAVHAHDGRRLVVKIAPPGADLAQVQWQHELLADLAGRPGLPPVPQVVVATDGSSVVATTMPGDVARRTAGDDTPDGVVRAVRVHTWLPGRTIAELTRRAPGLRRDWGAAAAHLVTALAGRAPQPGAPVTHHWELLRAAGSVESVLWALTDRERLRTVDRIMGWFADVVVPRVRVLPAQVVHQDLNDFNLLAAPDTHGVHRLSGVLDFTDAVHTARVSELAVAVAYAMLREPEPLQAAADVVAGFVDVAPLTDDELACVYPLAAARLCVNALTWTAREADNPSYARARMQHTWPTLDLLARTPPSLAEAWLRAALGQPVADGAARRVEDALGAVPVGTPVPELRGAHLVPARDPVRRRTTTGAPATLRLGVDVTTESAGVRTPRAGVVQSVGRDAVVVRHEPDAGPVYWTRWLPVTTTLTPGAPVAAGDVLGHARAAAADGGYGDGRAGAGTVRVAAFVDPALADLAPADVVTWTSAAAWRRVCPDPATVLGAPSGRGTGVAGDGPDLLALRRRHLAGSQRAYYDDPPHLVGSRDVWLHDDRSLAYLDVMNNVTHVGHANPAVVSALHRQAARLNTNSRLVYDDLARYAARLAGLLPDPLEVVFFVCTGSEANDLALRIARQVTGRRDVMVIDGAYHGNTGVVTGVSPDRYKGPGGAGAPPTTHEVIIPDRYRGPFGYDDALAGERYGADVSDVAERLVATGRAPAAFLAESLMGTAGTIVHPPGYLASAYAAARRAGALCIADEVQVGFGRMGSDFWGFQTQAVVPDIVTMGKPIGNGHPMAAVVTTRAIADAFDTGMKYFNTFAGNPVSCAVGNAVLDEIASRGLQAAAGDVGAHLRARLDALADRHPLVGDVRGHGLYLGVELVRDRGTREPADVEARYVSERLKDEGVAIYPTGRFGNVLKIKPPMTFTRDHADVLAATLDDVLDEDW